MFVGSPPYLPGVRLLTRRNAGIPSVDWSWQCSSGRSSTRTSAAPPIWSATRQPASPRSSTPSGTSRPTSTSHACTGCGSSTCSRPTTTPTTSPATAVWRGRPGRRSTSTSWPSAEYEHEPFADGWVLELGDGASIEAIHTPGHRPEHTSFLLRDGTRGGDPVAVLTGDSLFVGDVARPDLAIEPRAGAAEIFRSLNERLMALPDEVEVWPGHLGGSMCGELRDRPQDLIDDRVRAPP